MCLCFVVTHTSSSAASFRSDFAQSDEERQAAKEEKTPLRVFTPSLSQLSPQWGSSGRRTKLATTCSCLTAFTFMCVDSGRSQNCGRRAAPDMWSTAKKSSVFTNGGAVDSGVAVCLCVKTKLSLQFSVWNSIEFFFSL